MYNMFKKSLEGKMCLNPMHIDHQDYVGVNKFTFSKNELGTYLKICKY